MVATASEDEIRRFSLRAGDVMFTKDSESFDDIGIPAVADDGLESVVLGYHLMLARPKSQLHGPYLAWFFTPQRNRWQFEVAAKGVTRFGMPQSGFKDALVPLPPLDEQRAIAAFLDAMDARITRFIAARKKMILLLEEKKQAVINQAVTKGLDPTVPMKHSGVDWLGEIPAHWEVRRSRYVLREVDQRAADDSLLRLSMSQKYGLVPNTDIESWRLQSVSAIGAKIAQQDDLVLNRLKAHLAVFAHAPITGTVSPDYTVLRPLPGTNVRYFEALYKTPRYRDEFFKRTKGIVEGFWRLYTDAFYGVPVPWPPASEQQDLVDYVGHLSSDTRRAAERANKEIELLQEYRTRLISDVVTGKLDVRGVDLGELPEFEGIPELDEDYQPIDEEDGALMGAVEEAEV